MKKKTLPAVRRHIQIYEEDWLFLEECFGKHTSQPIGPGPAVCAIVHARVKALKAKIISRLDQATPGEATADSRLIEQALQGKPSV